jgi:AcrR family transcriptional regulator
VIEKKREILEAASRVFRRKGVQATGMRDIAAELSMTVGTLYYYFRNKQELLAFCQQDGLDGLLALAEALRSQPLPPQERLARLIAGHVERVNQGTPGALAHLEVEGLSGELRQAMLERRGQYERRVRALIEDGIRAGVFRPVDAKVAALAILGALNWTVKWFRPDGEKSAGEIGREFAELQVRGLLADGVTFEPAARRQLHAV